MINVKIDSRKVVEGDIFVAIKGNNVDGHDYIADAIKNGAKFIVSEKDVFMPASIGRVTVKDTKKWLEDYLIFRYSKIINKLTLIGITGTNGKTTSAYLTYQLLNMLGLKTSYIGTIGYYMPDKHMDLVNTTPNILELYDLLLNSLENNCCAVVMEVSSQGLDMNRTKGLEFDIASFTNLTQDHLDYHGSMENYLHSKLKILDQLYGKLIINDDSDVKNVWEDNYKNYFSYGLDGDIKLVSYGNTLDGTNIVFTYLDKTYSVDMKLKGKFNIYNMLNVISICLNLGYDINKILECVPYINPPKGRCEIIKCNGGIVVVDYAHTPDAVLKIIDTFKSEKLGKLTTIVGCGGNRDKTKRPIMGNIATINSDYVVFTDDNPRCEDHEEIVKDILSGVNTYNYEVILDRHDAIIKTIDNMMENDIVLILGKGHEDYQIIGTEKIHFDDSEIVRSYIENKNKVRKFPH